MNAHAILSGLKLSSSLASYISVTSMVSLLTLECFFHLTQSRPCRPWHHPPPPNPLPHVPSHKFCRRRPRPRSRPPTRLPFGFFAYIPSIRFRAWILLVAISSSRDFWCSHSTGWIIRVCHHKHGYHVVRILFELYVHSSWCV